MSSDHHLPSAGKHAKKICTKCKQEKLASTKYFHRDVQKKDKLTPQCIECRHQYRADNVLSCRKNSTDYYKANKERLKQKAKERRKIDGCKGNSSSKNSTKIKRESVLYLGGKCLCCGFDKCDRSLHFHHRDPLTKEGGFNEMRNWSAKRRKEELDKCDLLCANCHMAYHSGHVIKTEKGYNWRDGNSSEAFC